MKEETLKAKLAKTLEKKELVKKYDDYILNKPAIENKPPIKKEKKRIYKQASSSSSSSSEDDNEDEKIVYVKKCKKRNNKNNKIPHNKPENTSLDSTLYKSSQEILHSRAIEERVRANLIKWNNAMMPQEY